MKDSLLTDYKKKEIVKSISKKDYPRIISILENIKTVHANTAKTKDKRFVISEIVRYILNNSSDKEKDFFNTGTYFCKRNEDVSKEIGISLIWRSYGKYRKETESIFLLTADDPNWEVREYAGVSFAAALNHNDSFYRTLQKWSKHKSENVRRAVVISALGYRDAERYRKAFLLLEPLLFDNSKYVRKNLGPFILGSCFGNKFPEEILKQLKKWGKYRDENVRWNVIMAFNNSYGNKHPEYAFDVLKMFTGDIDITVKRALMSTLNFLGKRHGKEVKKFIDKYKLNKDKEVY
ncbi:MAG: hypothetical protein JNJ56_07475 [Ignavibacteria bacterium]|nr:hypothetical protein [Ignavibacteria bacterium]